MKQIVFAAIAIIIGFGLGRITVQSPEITDNQIVEVAEVVPDNSPTCVMCLADYVSAEEIQAYEEVAVTTSLTDQQLRSIDLGNANVQIALARRPAQSEPNPRSVAVHNLVTEVYYVLSGSGTNVTGPDLIDAEPRPDDYRAVVYLNGPGQNAAGIRNGTTQELKAGDVFVIPAGTGHQFTKIDDHISYIMVRIDPRQVVPLMDEKASLAYLLENDQ